MKFKFLKRALGAASLAALMAVPAFAGVVTFEEPAAGTLVFAGDAFSSGGMSFMANGSFGTIDTVAAYGAGSGLDLAAPRGNATQFYAGFNDSSLTMKAADGSAFRLAGLDFVFVSALTDLFLPGELPGFLVAAYTAVGGATGVMTWSFDVADLNGEFNFRTLGLSDMGVMSSGVTQVDFFACTANAAGDCVQGNVNFSQFAVDNITVPEPGSLALVALALGVAGGLRKRRSV